MATTGCDFNRRLHELLVRAMELDGTARAAFVREACADDPAMAARLTELFESDGESDGPDLDRPTLGAGPDGWDGVPDAVGDYLVIGVLGVGGMATVYEAIQGHPKRTVALKVMNQGIASPAAYARFRFETETLARLRHPGIAQIYEAGAAQLRRGAPAPFFAMELVPGALPITAYAREHGLSLRDRLAMFASVCDAVEHGHQHGVIHRDLKPANVLVDHEGRSKVIDFGVARTTGGDGEPVSLSLGERQLVGTLNYMSPEQCRAGGDVDTRADVYSLGVILYELVCDRLPHDLQGLPLPAALHAVMNDPPLRPQLGGGGAARDVQAVILKAIEKDPDGRYGSVSALSADLRRYLNHQAVEAGQPSVANYCRLFVRRHRSLVAAGVAVGACVLLVAVVSLSFAVRLNKEVGRRRVAEQRATSERDAARWEAYIAQISGALAAMRNGEFRQMRTRLEDSSGVYRGWEWGFLSRLAEKSVRATTAPGGMVMDLGVSRDQTRFATAMNDGSVSLWDARSGSLLATWEDNPDNTILSVCFTADGRFVVCGDESGGVRLLDGADLSTVRVLRDSGSRVLNVDALDDGRVVAVAADGSGSIFSVDSGDSVPFPGDQAGRLQGVEVDPGRSVVASFDSGGSIWVRDAGGFVPRLKLQFPGGINQVRFSDDGSMIAAVGESSKVVVWSLTDGSLLHEIQATDGVNTVRSVAFSHDGSQLAVGLTHRGVRVFSVDDGSLVGELGGHTDAVSGLWFYPDDRLLLTVSWDQTVRTWRAAEFASESGVTVLDGRRGYVRGVAFSPDGSQLAFVSHDGTLQIWDPDLAEPVALVDFGSGLLSALAFSPDGRQIAVASGGNAVRILDAYTGRVVAELPGDHGSVAAVSFDPSGERLVAGGRDGTVCVWDVATRQPVHLMTGHRARVNSVCFSPDGSLIASGSRDHTVRVWDAGTGAERFSSLGHDSDVFAVLFSPDGGRLYSGSRDQTIRVWDPGSGALVSTLQGHGQYITCLSLNAEGTRLAAGSWFGEIVLFDTGTYDQIASFRAHDSAIRGIAFSPDGRWLASGSYDSTVHLHDSATREESDAARESARLALEAARQRVGSVLAPAAGDATDVMGALRAAGCDPSRDPWVRKAVLAGLAPRDGDGAEGHGSPDAP